MQNEGNLNFLPWYSIQTFWNINIAHCVSATSVPKSQMFWVVMPQARQLYLDIRTQSIFFSKFLWELSVYMHVYLETQKCCTDLGFLLSCSTTSNQPHLSAWTGVPGGWDTPLSVMETALCGTPRGLRDSLLPGYVQKCTSTASGFCWSCLHN